MKNGPKYHNINIRLVGENGNAFNILGICLRAMREGDLPKTEQDEFYKEATSGNYDHLLATCLEWFDVE